MQWTGNWRDIIEDDSIDAVVIGTWPYMHHTLVIEALQAGKHVLTEARMVSEPHGTAGSTLQRFLASFCVLVCYPLPMIIIRDFCLVTHAGSYFFPRAADSHGMPCPTSLTLGHALASFTISSRKVSCDFSGLEPLCDYILKSLLCHDYRPWMLARRSRCTRSQSGIHIWSRRLCLHH
jgi:hypothetical protein